MATIPELYKVLFLTGEIQVACKTEVDYSTLRAGLNRQHEVCQLLLELTPDKLCSRYNAKQGFVTFRLGEFPTDFVIGDSDA